MRVRDYCAEGFVGPAGITKEDWRALQAADRAREEQELIQAFERLYLAARELERRMNCELPDLRSDIRLVEMKVHGSM